MRSRCHTHMRARSRTRSRTCMRSSLTHTIRVRARMRCRIITRIHIRVRIRFRIRVHIRIRNHTRVNNRARGGHVIVASRMLRRRIRIIERVCGMRSCHNRASIICRTRIRSVYIACARLIITRCIRVCTCFIVSIIRSQRRCQRRIHSHRQRRRQSQIRVIVLPLYALLVVVLT